MSYTMEYLEVWHNRFMINSHRAIARCFGLGVFPNLVLFHLQPANIGGSFYRKPPVVLQHLARCQILLAHFQKYPTWSSLVLTDLVLTIETTCGPEMAHFLPWPLTLIYKWPLTLTHVTFNFDPCDLWPWLMWPLTSIITCQTVK